MSEEEKEEEVTTRAAAASLDRSEARAFASKIRAIGHIVANDGNVFDEEALTFAEARGLTLTEGVLGNADLQALREEMAQLEEQAHKWLTGSNLSYFRIITPDESGPSSNPKDPDFNRLDNVVKVQVEDVPKIIELSDGSLRKVSFKVYTAIGNEFDHYRFTLISGGETTHRYIGVKPGSDAPLPMAGETVTAVSTNDHHEVKSSPEGFYMDPDGSVHQYGGATSLAKRLLEAYCSGAV